MTYDTNGRARSLGAHAEEAVGARASVVTPVRPIEERAEAVARVVATRDEILCFPLGGGCRAVLAAIDGRAALRDVFTRADVTLIEGFAYVSALYELGLIELG